ncbi:MAG: hypothetical protein A3A98_01860 [Candidatus Staskawiczbacteria bacterium RIFCSPLOWO2_01_FULL_40_39]|uniref:Uncharacterized protein n=1 Tax=Candidatus Staskawiczbacteria bacterium RIFCSPHIGHO2_01_FULL_39_25 TaxID=1802202 RepID=A0A1G2HS47_9BACT|nr:MAG: hypothetical protein A2730_02015 [Candidatus Staskawiczbacteria bacterium RIFCSPHIGHO2_01_FULL_39_25]OGZ72716.1 MAG: hypothetical protein A3A98_01860 [Candidatus Staskawiczbacteria bacterium RIFCSPLOWO2_01_FULL_40_39]OGZ76601.1 MAG: hypothetical protein A3I87_02985 [Candidatus Staskawiczbacteria bacterium RIFCSPLOWO2_02_FULL_39_8]
MTILALTHAGRFNFANAFHTKGGLEDLHKLKEIVLSFLSGKEEKIKSLATGVGKKYEEILELFLDSNIFIPEKIVLCPYLGGAESTIKGGTIISPSGNEYANYLGLSDTASWDPWAFLKENFCGNEDDIAILCTGKQFLRALGKEKYFKVASMYELLTDVKSISWKAKAGKLLKKPIIG